MRELCAGKSPLELRRIYFELLHEIFNDTGNSTAKLEAILKQMLGENVTVGQLHPPPYFMCTTTRVDVEPQQLMLVRYLQRKVTYVIFISNFMYG